MFICNHDTQTQIPSLSARSGKEEPAEKRLHIQALRTNGWLPNVPQHVTTFHRPRSELVFSYDVHGMAIAIARLLLLHSRCSIPIQGVSKCKLLTVRQRTDPFQTWGSWTQRRSMSQSQNIMNIHQVTGWIHIPLQPIICTQCTLFSTIRSGCVSLFSYYIYYSCRTHW